jgi:N-acetylglucosamine kinase-like BadF-type ATPase
VAGPQTTSGSDGVLAIDAGNSKTDVAIIAADGSLRGVARGGGFSPHLVGPDAAVAGLVPLVSKAAADAGLAYGDGSVLVDHVSACLANADLPLEQQGLTTAIEARQWGRSCRVVNDTFALLRTGVDTSRGIAVICGAGINCTGMLPDGRTARFAAVGHISGDWGGGGHLWQEAMWWAARAEDGRGPETELRTALPRHFGLASMAALIEAVHLEVVSPEDCLEMTPLLFAVAETGDAVAIDVVRRQAREIVTLAVTAMRRLDVLSAPIDVVLGGGVLTAGHAVLMDAVRDLLAAAAPHAVIRVVEAPPVVGAGLLGLDSIDAAPQAHARLRASYPGGRPAATPAPFPPTRHPRPGSAGVSDGD